MHNNAEDPVDAQCAAITAEGMVDWLIKYHSLPEGARDIVTLNLRQQFRWHRLQGRCDRRPFLLVLAELFRVRQSAKELRSPFVLPAQ
jgi:hypothetical protein